MTYVLPSIALCGPRGSGKTTIADLLRGRYFVQRHSWAAPVKAIAVLAYGPIGKSDPVTVRRDGLMVQTTGLDILQRIGTDAIRDRVDEDFWVRAGIRGIDPLATYVNDDTRFPNEAEALRALGWCIVSLFVGDEQRQRRLVARGDPDMSVDHPSERWWEIVPDFTIDTTNETAEETLDHLLTLVVQRQQIGRYTVAKGGGIDRSAGRAA
jgi:hypothetical protein